MLRRRPLLRRVPWEGSPTSSLVLRRSDFSRPGWLSSSPRFPVPADCAGDTRSPKFLGDPCACATSPTDPGAALGQDSRGRAPALRPKRCCLPRAWPCWPSPRPAFGAYPRGPFTRCLRFAAALTVPTTQDSLPGGGPRPYRDGILTRKVTSKGFRSLHRFLLSQALLGATGRQAGRPSSSWALARRFSSADGLPLTWTACRPASLKDFISVGHEAMLEERSATIGGGVGRSRRRHRAAQVWVC
jgi:hypothetical protein